MPTNGTAKIKAPSASAKVGSQLLLNPGDKERAQILAFAREDSQAETMRMLVIASLPRFEGPASSRINEIRAKLKEAGVDVPSAVDAFLKARIRSSVVLEMEPAQIRRMLGIAGE